MANEKCTYIYTRKICLYKSQNFIDPSINISELSKGIYTIKVINDKTSFQSKLFVN